MADLNVEGPYEDIHLQHLHNRGSSRRRDEGISTTAGSVNEHDGHAGASQLQRVKAFQRRWQSIKEDLPPQLTRRHIGMISIGGVIGTGLFLGSADALHYGGPVGALLGYSIIGTVVYCLCVSIGEMIAFLPNVGGVVGIADLYVDPALGFSMGWAAWYNWSVTLPSEITAAAIVVKHWETSKIVDPTVLSTIFLAFALFINLFPSRIYGEFEFWFSAMKVLMIVFIIVASFLIDLGVGDSGRLGFRYWKNPGPFAVNYLGVPGAKGRFLGFWAVLMQAAYSFTGSEVPGIAAGEVIDATRNVPRALRRVWVRITLFYVLGILFAGLLVRSDDPALIKSLDTQPDATEMASESRGWHKTCENGTTTYSSPFVVAFQCAGINGAKFSQFINAAVLISTWSAAASDIYISSRFLFFLARCKHAPHFFASLIKYPSTPATGSREDVAIDSQPLMQGQDTPSPHENNDEGADIADHDESTGSCESDWTSAEVSEVYSSPELEPGVSMDVEHATMVPKQRQPWLVLPLYAVLGSASIGFLSFLNQKGIGNTSAETVFGWLVAMTGVASIQSWLCMMFVYLRWYRGTLHAERNPDGPRRDHESDEEIELRRSNVKKQIKKIKENRHWGQPYLAYYAFAMCAIILITNGMAVFIHNGWEIAEDLDNQEEPYTTQEHVPNPALTFLSCYLPIPIFVLFTLGYKLIYQTKLVRTHEMEFNRGDVDEDEQRDPPYNGRWNRWLGKIFVF